MVLTGDVVVDHWLADDPDVPKKNWPLLWKVYDHIIAHPEEWDQKKWSTRTTAECGTAFCFAGHAVMMAIPTATPTFVEWVEAGVRYVVSNTFVDATGQRRDWNDAAMRELGLTYPEAQELFAVDNTIVYIHDLLIRWEREELGND